jgi:hypothetical protein
VDGGKPPGVLDGGPMNADAAAWMAGCIIILITIPAMTFLIWAYLQSVQSQAEYDRLVEERRLQGQMQVPDVKLYILAKS